MHSVVLQPDAQLDRIINHGSTQNSPLYCKLSTCFRTPLDPLLKLELIMHNHNTSTGKENIIQVKNSTAGCYHHRASMQGWFSQGKRHQQHWFPGQGFLPGWGLEYSYKHGAALTDY